MVFLERMKWKVKVISDILMGAVIPVLSKPEKSMATDNGHILMDPSMKVIGFWEKGKEKGFSLITKAINLKRDLKGGENFLNDF